MLTYDYWHSHFQDDRGAVGRTVRLNKHPFTIIGVAPPGFQGPVLFFSTDFFVPFMSQQQAGSASALNARGNPSLLMTIGHLKTRVTPAQASGDLNEIGSYLQRTYPKTAGQMNQFLLTRPNLFGDTPSSGIHAFMTGLMLLAALILFAACANLGGLFAARAADRGCEVALRLALGASRTRILRALFTEAPLISLMGGPSDCGAVLFC